MDGTILSQGTFVSDGNSRNIVIPSGVDWMVVRNVTVAAASQTTAVGVEYFWQRGFPAGAQWEYKKSNAANAANLSSYATSGGFTLIDTSANPQGVLNNGSTGISAISTAATPVVTVGSTAGMAAGNIVRLVNTTDAPQLSGLDFTIGYGTFTGTTFSLDYMSQLLQAGTGGEFRVIKYEPLFYPRSRFITAISNATQAVIQLSVTHGYKVGQLVRIIAPDVYLMPEINGLQATIVDVNTATTAGTGNTITVDIDSSSFGTFSFPGFGIGNSAFTPAMIVPIGEDTAEALALGVDILSDATVNTGYIGMNLAAGANSPAGSASDVIYWIAGKSSFGGL